eukprot:Rhum_TRINITY_DN14762_c2_g1::Rhum_TRINITY_DN14762_c2_g1_i1::g.113826::m.113826
MAWDQNPIFFCCQKREIKKKKQRQASESGGGALGSGLRSLHLRCRLLLLLLVVVVAAGVPETGLRALLEPAPRLVDAQRTDRLVQRFDLAGAEGVLQHARQLREELDRVQPAGAHALLRRQVVRQPPALVRVVLHLPLLLLRKLLLSLQLLQGDDLQVVLLQRLLAVRRGEDDRDAARLQLAGLHLAAKPVQLRRTLQTERLDDHALRELAAGSQTQLLLLLLRHSTLLDALRKSLHALHEGSEAARVLHALEEGVDDVARVTLLRLGQLGDAREDLGLPRTQLHLLAVAVHLRVEAGKEEVPGGVLLEQHIAVLLQDLARLLHRLQLRELLQHLTELVHVVLVRLHLRLLVQNTALQEALVLVGGLRDSVALGVRRCLAVNDGAVLSGLAHVVGVPLLVLVHLRKPRMALVHLVLQLRLLLAVALDFGDLLCVLLDGGGELVPLLLFLGLTLHTLLVLQAEPRALLNVGVAVLLVVAQLNVVPFAVVRETRLAGGHCRKSAQAFLCLIYQ